jgi:hypothetical protein
LPKVQSADEHIDDWFVLVGGWSWFLPLPLVQHATPHL